MINLDLTKDPILVLLLNNIVRTTSRISIHDQSLNQKIEELKAIQGNLKSVDYSVILSTINRLAEIVKSYEQTHHYEEKEIGEESASLPSVIFNFIEKLNELKTRTYLDQKYFSVAELEQRIENFCKLASK